MRARRETPARAVRDAHVSEYTRRGDGPPGRRPAAVARAFHAKTKVTYMPRA